MTRGPVELVVIAFPGALFSSKIMPTLDELVNSKMVRILDLTFVKKDAAGVMQPFEFHELPPEEQALFERIGGEIYSVISEEDVKAAAAAIPNNSVAALIIWENTLDTHFRKAVLQSDGMLIAYVDLNPKVIDAILAKKT